MTLQKSPGCSNEVVRIKLLGIETVGPSTAGGSSGIAK